LDSQEKDLFLYLSTRLPHLHDFQPLLIITGSLILPASLSD